MSCAVFYLHSISWFIVAVAIYEEKNFSYSGALLYAVLVSMIQEYHFRFSYKITFDTMQNIVIIYILIIKPKFWLIAFLRRRVVLFRIVMSASYDIHWEKILSHFDPKSWVTRGTKSRHGKVGNWRIFESNWLNIESQVDSTLRVKLTQHWESNWLNIESQIYSTLTVKLTQPWQSKWLNRLTVKFTQPWQSNLLKYYPVIHFAGSNFSSTSDSTFKVKMTQIFSLDV